MTHRPRSRHRGLSPRRSRADRHGRARIAGMLSAAALALLIPAVSGCSTADEPGLRRLEVLAAASLTNALPPIEARLEADNPGLDVEISYAGSSTIVSQVNHGAPADVIALASMSSLDPLDPALRHGAPVRFASNVLVIAVPAANPGGIATLSDLAQGDLRVVICDVQVPCGSAAATALERGGVAAHVVSREADVRSVLTKVRLGEADAGLVYSSDVAAAAGEVTGIAITGNAAVRNDYPALAVSDSADAALFLAALTSAEGRADLAAAGLETP